MAFQNSSGSDVHGSTFSDVGRDQINIQWAIINNISPELLPPGTLTPNSQNILNVYSQSVAGIIHCLDIQATLQSGASSQCPTTKSVNIEAILDGAVAAQSQKLTWRTSVVDLMKVLKLDSSLQARRKLAARLVYDSDTSDTWKMNIWLHEQIMKRLAENGGEVPDDLKV